MPTYTVTDPQTKKTVKLTGDSPPTEAELTEIFAKMGGGTPPAAKPPQQPRQSGLATIGEMVGDTLGGLRSSAARTIYGGGDLIRRATGMDRVIDTPEVQSAMQAPDSTTGKLASFGGDLAQFFIPTGAAGKMAKVAEVAKSGALTLAQTGSPVSAGLSAGLTAIVPGGGAMKRAANALDASAEKSVAQALGATKEAMKAEATKLAPQIIERRLGGSRQAMLEQARTMATSVGQQLNAAYKAAGAAGETVSGDVIRGAVQLSSDALKVKNAAGTMVVIPGTERVVSKLAKLDEFVESLGPDISVDKAAHIKRTFDNIVAKAGLYGQKVGASATDQSDAWALREAAGAFRELLNRSPTLADLNKEAAFWTGLKRVLVETEKRTQAQSGGLVAAGMGGSGAIVGALSGDSASDRATKALLGGIAGRQLIKAVQSPAFRTKVAAPLKAALADAMASGSTERVMSALGRISAAVPGQLSTAAAAAQ